MHCPIRTGEGTELFLEYGSGTLKPAINAAFEAHMASCEDCLRLAKSQRNLWNTLDSWEAPEVSVDFDRQLYARIALEKCRPWYQRWFHCSDLNLNWQIRRTMPVGAACAAVLAAFLFHGPNIEPKPETAVEAKHFDIEQVERALDDIDMLNQLGVVPAMANQTHHPESM